MISQIGLYPDKSTSKRRNYSSNRGFFLICFFWPVRCLVSRIFRLILLGVFVGTRIFGRSRSFASFFVRFSRQRILLRYWLRSSLQIAVRPVERWRNRTPLSVLFWCWPPLPPDLNVSTSQSIRRSRRLLGFIASPLYSEEHFEIARHA
jgi:hypothetical protein